MFIYSCIGLRKSVLSRPFCGYYLKNNVSFKKKSALVQNRRWIMSILDVCCLSETKTFEQFSDFLAFTLSSKNSHQFGQNQPTDKFHHSIESWEWGEEDRTWAGGLRRFWRPPKRRNISLPNLLATVVLCLGKFVKLRSVVWDHLWYITNTRHPEPKTPAL